MGEIINRAFEEFIAEKVIERAKKFADLNSITADEMAKGIMEMSRMLRIPGECFCNVIQSYKNDENE
jgi:hypothetical protein